MKMLVTRSAIAVVLLTPLPAWAQGHSGHQNQAPAPTPPPAPVQDHSGHDMPEPPLPAGPPPASRPTTAPTPMDPGQMDHGQMDHGAMGHGAQDHSAMAGMSGEGSGTARVPANEAMDGLHVDLGNRASLMLHGYAWGVYTRQTGPRGDDKLYVQSMAMARLSKAFDGGRLSATAMMSLEPAMDSSGYPNLFATGETSRGAPLVDRQHPHDLFMELSARLDIDIGENATAFLYGGPVGEPALGPSAFMHRASARYNSEAPITHHWFDSTHITYGVVTAGIAARRFQIEASAFRGREPDEFRWNIEKLKLDSWSARASFAPSPAWLIQASYGEMKEPEELHPGEDEHRATASVHYNSGRGLSGMLAFSAKNRVPGPTLTAWLGEANWDIGGKDGRNTLFGRIESVANDELFPDHDHPLHDQTFRVAKFQIGYARRIPLGPLELALGGSLAAFAKPAALTPFYGKHPLGYTLFAKVTLGAND